MSLNRQDYFSKANLKERGWTDTAIVRFLGQEDQKAPNSHNRYSPVCLYLKGRVIRTENTPEFQIWQEKSRKRSESAKKAAQTRLLREAQEEQLRAEQLRDFNARMSASALAIQPLTHKELMQIVVNRWNEQNPSPPIYERKTIRLSVEIKHLPKPSQQKFTALINHANGALTRHFERVDKNAHPADFTKSINDIFASIRGLIKFFKKQERLTQLMVIDVDFAQAIANHKQLEPMLNWLTEIIDFIENDPEVAVCPQEGVDLVPLVTEEVLFQHRDALSQFHASLVEIVEQFPLVSNRYEIVSRKFVHEIMRSYPALSQGRLVESISAENLNLQQIEQEALAVV